MSASSAPSAWCVTRSVLGGTRMRADCRLRHRVAQEEFDAELDPPLALDDCGHSFHLQCLLSWSERRPTNRTCPLCGARMHSSQLGG